MKKNVLGYHNLLKLSVWIQSKLQHLQQSEPTRTHVAELATKELGFTVTHHNIDGILESLELKIPFKIERKRVKNPVTSKRLDVLRMNLIYLFERCGEPVPSNMNVENW